MDHPFKNSTIISYCPGFLGLERGIERAIGKLRTAVYVEIEAFICENLLAGMEAGILDAAPIWANLKTFDAKPFRGIVDGITGGYPCQPFSTAGNRRGTEDPRHLWPYLERDIRAIRPVWCFFENVSGHLTLGYREVRQSLESMGYQVKEGIFTAEEVGAPHRRERLFIIAIRKEYVGYANSKSMWGNTGGFYAEITSTGKELADTGLQRQEKHEQQTAGIEQCSKELADTHCSRSRENTQSTELWPNRIEQSPGYSGITSESKNKEGRFDRWPARPGRPQYNWEEPRTVEPGVGSSINGYNFREDLLRAYGNSVVEQTAELAFKTLLNQI